MNKLQQQKSQNTNGLFSKSDLAHLDCFDDNPSIDIPFSECQYFSSGMNHLISEAISEKTWHSHSGLQVLIATDGNGYYQEKGKPVQVLNTGDVVFILPKVLHWHLTADKSQFTDITIAGGSRDEIITWLQRSVD